MNYIKNFQNVVEQMNDPKVRVIDKKNSGHISQKDIDLLSAKTRDSKNIRNILPEKNSQERNEYIKTHMLIINQCIGKLGFDQTVVKSNEFPGQGIVVGSPLYINKFLLKDKMLDDHDYIGLLESLDFVNYDDTETMGVLVDSVSKIGWNFFTKEKDGCIFGDYEFKWYIDYIFNDKEFVLLQNKNHLEQKNKIIMDFTAKMK